MSTSHSTPIRSYRKSLRMIGERSGKNYGKILRCDHEPTGDFVGQTFGLLEVIPDVFSTGAKFTNIKTGQRYVMTEQGLDAME